MGKAFIKCPRCGVRYEITKNYHVCDKDNKCLCWIDKNCCPKHGLKTERI